MKILSIVNICPMVQLCLVNIWCEVMHQLAGANDAFRVKKGGEKENIFQIGHQFHKSSLDTLEPQHNGDIFCGRIEIFGEKKECTVPV